MLKVLSYILCDLDPKVKVIGQKAGICDGVPSTSALVDVVIVTKVCQIVRQILKKTIATFKRLLLYKKKYVKVILLHNASLIYVLFQPSWACLFKP